MKSIGLISKFHNGNALFTDEEVLRIRAECELGDRSYLEIAQAWKCGMQTIRKINRRETYGWVPEGEGHA